MHSTAHKLWKARIVSCQLPRDPSESCGEVSEMETNKAPISKFLFPLVLDVLLQAFGVLRRVVDVVLVKRTTVRPSRRAQGIAQHSTNGVAPKLPVEALNQMSLENVSRVMMAGR